MKRKQKIYDAKFKAQVAFESIKDEKKLIEICTINNVPKTSAIEWRDRLLREAETIFVPAYEKQREVKVLKQEIESLHKVIGEVYNGPQNLDQKF